MAKGGLAMKKIKILFILILILLGFNGCIAGAIILKNDKGETVRCESSKGPLDNCVKEYEAKGYKKAEPEVYSFPPMEPYDY